MANHPENGYENLNVFYGDLHNHCGLSYGRGSFAEAIKNARLQLDFASVTLHAVWPDIPKDDPRLGYLVDYHKDGFEKASANWDSYLKQIDTLNQDGKFVLFPSYEWHSNQYGDYCIYYKSGLGNQILEGPDLPALRNSLAQAPSNAMMIPHHIGYKQGYRGINWNAFSNQLSPVAEIYSFHGSSESSEGPYPYLHTMGPRHEHSCAQYGWSQGHIFGVIGSTDHHNAFPGSYGAGRMAVWAEALSRDAIWDAIQNRRTYALTGDRISLAFSLNHYPMGDICPADEERKIEVTVHGGSSIDYIEILHNNKIIHRECPSPSYRADDRYKVYLELGWGEEKEDTIWDVDFNVDGGLLHSVEPRFRGFNAHVIPKGGEYAYTDWQMISPNQVRFHTQTRPNHSHLSASTEGMCFEIQGNADTRLIATINGNQIEYSLSELFTGTRTHYLGGFVSPALSFHRAVPRSEYEHSFSFLHFNRSSQRDWYSVRVRERNDQWAWSSPIWIES